MRPLWTRLILRRPLGDRGVRFGGGKEFDAAQGCKALHSRPLGRVVVGVVSSEELTEILQGTHSAPTDIL